MEAGHVFNQIRTLDIYCLSLTLVDRVLLQQASCPRLTTGMFHSGSRGKLLNKYAFCYSSLETVLNPCSFLPFLSSLEFITSLSPASFYYKLHVILSTCIHSFTHLTCNSASTHSPRRHHFPCSHSVPSIGGKFQYEHKSLPLDRQLKIITN